VFYVFLLAVGLAALGVYVTLILNLVPGAAEERLGVLEELPPDIGVWKVDDVSPEDDALAAQGLSREVRLYHQQNTGWAGRERLIRQVRYRNRATGEIVRVEPDRVIKRRRVKR